MLNCINLTHVVVFLSLLSQSECTVVLGSENSLLHRISDEHVAYVHVENLQEFAGCVVSELGLDEAAISALEDDGDVSFAREVIDFSRNRDWNCEALFVWCEVGNATATPCLLIDVTQHEEIESQSADILNIVRRLSALSKQKMTDSEIGVLPLWHWQLVDGVFVCAPRKESVELIGSELSSSKSQFVPLLENRLFRRAAKAQITFSHSETICTCFANRDISPSIAAWFAGFASGVNFFQVPECFEPLGFTDAMCVHIRIARVAKRVAEDNTLFPLAISVNALFEQPGTGVLSSFDNTLSWPDEKFPSGGGELLSFLHLELNGEKVQSFLEKSTRVTADLGVVPTDILTSILFDKNVAVRSLPVNSASMALIRHTNSVSRSHESSQRIGFKASEGQLFAERFLEYLHAENTQRDTLDAREIWEEQVIDKDKSLYQLSRVGHELVRKEHAKELEAIRRIIESGLERLRQEEEMSEEEIEAYFQSALANSTALLDESANSGYLRMGNWFLASPISADELSSLMNADIEFKTRKQLDRLESFYRRIAKAGIFPESPCFVFSIWSSEMSRHWRNARVKPRVAGEGTKRRDQSTRGQLSCMELIRDLIEARLDTVESVVISGEIINGGIRFVTTAHQSDLRTDSTR